MKRQSFKSLIYWVVCYPNGQAEAFTLSSKRKEAIAKYGGKYWKELIKPKGFTVRKVELIEHLTTKAQ